jgi:Tol biopolymer transport system component
MGMGRKLLRMGWTLWIAPLVALGAEAQVEQKDPFMSRARQLTFEGRRAGEGYFSPDGKHLIFQSERTTDNPFFQIYTLNLETGDVHRVSDGTGKTTCAFFRPGSDEVLYASTHLDPQAQAKQAARLRERQDGKEPRYSWDYDAHMDIFSARRDGSQRKRLTDAPGYDAEGAYSPDGKKIVFCSLRDTPPAEKMTAAERKYAEADPAHFGEIYLMDADGSNQRRLTDWPGYDGGPFFTPDGTRIVWRHFEPGSMKADVYTMKLDGSDRRRLTDFGCMSWAPYFHPSGEYCIFNSNKLGMKNWELYMVDALGQKEPVQVTFSEGADVLPVFSPDGKRICWTSTRHGGTGRKGQLYLAEWNHAAAQQALAAAPPRITAKTVPADATELSAFAERQREIEKRAAQSQAVATELARFAERQRAVTPALSPEITESDLRSHVAYLASDELAGRMTGTPYAKTAADYIAEQFKAAGLQPAGDKGTYLQAFEFQAGVETAVEGNRLTLTGTGTSAEFKLDSDFRPLGLSQNGTFSGEAVFVGYGIVGEGYDAYGDLDVKDKCVILLRYFPEDVAVQRKTALARHASLRVKAMHARRLGAKALLVATGPNSPDAGGLMHLAVDGAGGSSGVTAASISLDTLKQIFARAKGDWDIAKIQKALDQEDPHTRTSFALDGMKLELSVNLVREQRACYNVLGLLPAHTKNMNPPCVVIGGHYDHLGHGEGGNAFGFDESKRQIYNGADDNASGVAVVLELAAAYGRQPGLGGKPRNHAMLFAAWSGEEIGLIGSDHFVEHSPIPLERIAAYVNFDMVGRMADNQLITQGAGSSPGWRKILERRNVPLGFDLTIQDDPYLPTDTMSFYRHKIPTLQIFTGSHSDYHRPSDTADTLNYPDLLRVARFSRLVLGDLVNRNEPLTYALVERKTTGGGKGMRMRAYTGTEPDYAYTGSDGMLLKGVIPGGPADQAGIKGGDLIVNIAGLSITNVYEYSHALSVLKPGESAKVTVVRGGERMELTITPGSRD